MKIYIISDNRRGNEKQAIALAEIMQWKYELISLQFNRLASLPNFLKFNLMDIKPECQKQLRTIKKGIVIAAGRRAALTAINLKRHEPSLKIIQILAPGSANDAVDLLIIPSHDPTPNIAKNKLITIHGALSSPLLPVDKKSMIYSKINKLAKPRVGIFIGGSSRSVRFTEEMFEDFLEKMIHFIEQTGYYPLITTGPRTPETFLAKLKEALRSRRIQHYLYDFNKAQQSKNADRGNPYNYIVQLSDAFIATADSVSVISELAILNKPLYYFMGAGMLSRRHTKFIEVVSRKGAAKLLAKNNKIFSAKSLNNISTIKKKISHAISKW